MDNIASTYRGIAETMPQSVVSDTPDVLICLAPFAHPLCNFAIVWNSQGVALAQQAASGRPHFCTYTFERSWAPRSWRLTQEMAILKADGTPGLDPLRVVMGARDRLIVARFMCSQFFDTQSRDVRERLAEATARVPQLELFTVGEHRIVGAGMLHERERAIGLYNICVDGAHRRRGWGASIVHQMLAECGRRNKPGILQCSPDLVDWYRRLGFRNTGKLFAWSISGN